MAKEIETILDLVIPAGQANPGPPLGPALSPYGINMGDFTNKFNEETREQNGLLLKVDLTIYKDRTFSFEIGNPPTSELIKRELGIKKGSKKPNLNKVGTLTQEQIKKIANEKIEDFNTNNLDKIAKIIEGQAQQMGIKVEK